MKLNKTEKLFVGCKIDSKLREGLAMAKPGDRKYFEDPDSEFLKICEFEQEKWIGKVVKGGLPVGDFEDVQRNVISILRRVAVDVRISPSSLRLFACEESDEPAALDLDPEPDDPADGGHDGPYIEF